MYRLDATGAWPRLPGRVPLSKHRGSITSMFYEPTSTLNF
jgi:hypothetical protein